MASLLLRVENLSKRFGGVHAVKNASFDLHEGEVLGLVGDNGAGKSTLIKMISGVLQPTSGKLYWKGEEAALSSVSGARNLGIETIYQDLALADNLGIAANVFLGREPARRALGFIPVLDRKLMDQRAEDVLARLQLRLGSMHTPVWSLSGGQRQSVAIGRAIFWDAELLIMDEPTAALGVYERATVLKLIKQLKKQGITIILISHNLYDIFKTTDQIAVMQRGRIVGRLETASTTEDEVIHMMIGTEAQV